MKKALLIVDVQRRIFNLKKHLLNPELLIGNILKLIESAREEGVQIIFIQHENQTTFKFGDPHWQLHEALVPEADDLKLRKLEGNAFYETDLKELLDERHIDTVYICGLLSNQCVSATTLGALENAYKTYLVEDAHSNVSIHAEETIRKVNRKLEKSGAELITTDGFCD